MSGRATKKGEVAPSLTEIRARDRLSPKELAAVLGASLASIARWEAGTAEPSPLQREAIEDLLRNGQKGAGAMHSVFASRGARRRERTPDLFEPQEEVRFAAQPLAPVIDRLTRDEVFLTEDAVEVTELLERHVLSAPTVTLPPTNGMSAGKNTYSYDAHTYHTKVPPQGIAELIRHYLPHGGLVFDPFSGSGMTGVAARAMGVDCLLAELSPAACFISSRFVSKVPPGRFMNATDAVLDRLDLLRRRLYATTCRECGKSAELLYTVWAYRVLCPHCNHEFNLWDVCRRYGQTVREHKILGEFECPSCSRLLRKSRLERTYAEPVQIAYMCCGSRQREQVHPPSDQDRDLIARLSKRPPWARGYFPTTPLPDGVNLGQPRRHGIDSVEKLYTRRNLAALSHLWKEIQRLEDDQLAGQVAFAFTSLYRRVTRLSEFRFWGGSGNTARLNVPFIFDEPNVFVAFRRKAKSIADHLATTADQYSANAAVRQGSATDLSYLPDNSIDLVFTDPPFGANINYSEMNLLWEAWLGRFTETAEEAIVNRVQGKDIAAYGSLMAQSLAECYRVLRPGHWMLLVFMNSSARVWEALRVAIADAGFVIVKADVFDKQHGTFKHFVSENTAGADLVLHCLKPDRPSEPSKRVTLEPSLDDFLRRVDVQHYLQPFLHVGRPTEIDLRRLYSEWVAQAIVERVDLMNFSDFREKALAWIERPGA